MAITTRGQVGPQAVADGAEQAMRMDKTAAQVVVERLGRHAEETYRGNLFHAGAPANIPVSGTAAGPCLFNPPNSGKLLVLEKVRIAVPAATAVAGTLFYAYQSGLTVAPTTTTAMNTIPGLVGSGARSTGLAYTIATLTAAAVEFMVMGEKAAVVASQIPTTDDIAGAVILGQGALLTLYTTNADTTPAHHVSFTWVEIPV